MKRPSRQSAQPARRGAAAVELAVCLPLLLMLLIGSLEAANAIFLKQGIQTAAYEAAREAGTTGGTQSSAEQRANDVLTARKIKRGTVTVSPPVTPKTPPGTEITVTVTAPAKRNSIGVNWFFTKKTLSATSTMVRQ